MLGTWINQIKNYFLQNVLYKQLLEKMKIGVVYKRVYHHLFSPCGDTYFYFYILHQNEVFLILTLKR